MELANRLADEDMNDAMALVSAWAQRDQELVKKVRAGVRRRKRQEQK